MKNRYCTLIIFLLLISCTDKPINGSNLSSLGFYSSPGDIIKKLKDKKKGYHEHFMLGLTYKNKKEYKKSILHFANSCFKSHRNLKIKLYPHPVYKFVNKFHLKSKYYDDALYEIAYLFYLYREHKYVIKFIDLISEDQKGLYLNSKLLKCQSLVSLSRYSDAISVLRNIDYKDSYSQSIINIRIGSTLEKMNKFSDAVEIYLKVIEINEKSWQASIASSRIIKIILMNNIQLKNDEMLILSKSLYYSRQYKQTALILKKIYSPKDYSNKDIRIYLIKSLTRIGDNKLQKMLLINAKKKSQLYYELTKARADELWAMKNKYQSVSLYKKIIKSGLEPISQESLKRIAIYMEDRRIKGYFKYLIDYKNKYKKDLTSEFFLWLLGRNKIRNKNYTDARVFFKEALEKFPDGRYSARCRFWLYKTNLKTDDANNKMILKNLIVHNPDSSYTWELLKKIVKNYKIKSLEKNYTVSLTKKNYKDALFYHTLLFIKEKNFKKRDNRIKNIELPIVNKYIDFEKSISDMDITSKNKNIFKSIEKYFAIGYHKAIKRELNVIPVNEQFLKDKNTILAHYGRKYKNHYLSAYYTLELLKLNSLKENILLLPEESIKRLYPLSFADCVDKFSKKYAIDKYAVYSVIKAESLFNHKATSPAGAVGLMQIMPLTAKGLARSLKIKKYNLADPCISIHFGTKYIAWLNKYFRGNFELAIAGYNAGAGHVDEWIAKKTHKDMDYFKEFIPFVETRSYIFRTGKFITIYRLIYEQQH